MSSDKFFGKSKEDLVLLATLGRVLSQKKADAMTQEELAAYLYDIDQKAATAQTGASVSSSADEVPTIKTPAVKATSIKTKAGKTSISVSDSGKSALKSSTEASPVVKQPIKKAKIEAESLKNESTLSKRELNRLKFIEELATKKDGSGSDSTEANNPTKIIMTSESSAPVNDNVAGRTNKTKKHISVTKPVKSVKSDEAKVLIKIDKTVKAGKPDKAIKTNIPDNTAITSKLDKTVKAGKPDKIVKASKPDKTIKAGKPGKVKSVMYTQQSLTDLELSGTPNADNPVIIDNPAEATNIVKTAKIAKPVKIDNTLEAVKIAKTVKIVKNDPERGIPVISPEALNSLKGRPGRPPKQNKSILIEEPVTTIAKADSENSVETVIPAETAVSIEPSNAKIAETITEAGQTKPEVHNKAGRPRKTPLPVIDEVKSIESSSANPALATDDSKTAVKIPDAFNKASKEKTLKHRIKHPEGEETSTTEGDTKSETSDDAVKNHLKAPMIELSETVEGVLEIMADGYGFLRKENYLQSAKDIFVPPQYIRRFNLRTGDKISGPGKLQRETDKYQAILYIKEVNGQPPENMIHRPQFDRLTPVYPDEKYILETTRNELSTRIMDMIAPIGKGQRGMIVSPPKAGKTILLQKIANAIATNNPETKLIVLLIDERPEEVTDMQRSIKGEVVYSTFDKTPENHVKIVELVLERAMRLVELGQDVVILLDSITRLGRAYNLTINPTGRTLSGGLDPGALYGPKRFFGAARNIEGGGSLTIIATALVETGSRMDEVIFEEFKGTGNMEVLLDRKLSEKRIFPAIDINRSGTRREELLLTKRELDAVWTIRKAFGQLDTAAVTEMIINLLLKTANNSHFISSVNVSLNDKTMYDAMRGGNKTSSNTGGNGNSYGNNNN